MVNEIIVVFENNIKPINTPCGQNEANVKVDGTHNYQSALKV